MRLLFREVRGCISCTKCLLGISGGSWTINPAPGTREGKLQTRSGGCRPSRHRRTYRQRPNQNHIRRSCHLKIIDKKCFLILIFSDAPWRKHKIGIKLKIVLLKSLQWNRIQLDKDNAEMRRRKTGKNYSTIGCILYENAVKKWQRRKKKLWSIEG